MAETDEGLGEGNRSRDRRDDKPTTAESACRNNGGRTNHRGNATLHILRSAAEYATVTFDRRKRRRHPRDTDGIQMAAQQQRMAGSTGIQYADNIGPSRSDVDDLDIQANRPHLVTHTRSDHRLPRSGWDKRRIDRVDCDQILQKGNGVVRRLLHPIGEEDIGVALCGGAAI